jgi:hypothetical protein
MLATVQDTKDCVWYYYLTKKRANYKQMMRKRRRKQVKVYRPPVMPRIEDIEATVNDAAEDALPAKQGTLIRVQLFNTHSTVLEIIPRIPVPVPDFWISPSPGFKLFPHRPPIIGFSPRSCCFVFQE